jgi:hypothetical protein
MMMDNYLIRRLRMTKALLLLLLLLMAECLVVTNCYADSRTYKVSPVKSVSITLPKDAGKVLKNIASVFIRRVEQRSGAKVRIGTMGELKIDLSINTNIGKDGFVIANSKNGGIRIIGNDERGVLYGIGKFLRISDYCKDGFIAGSWRGRSVPEKPVRGVYLATHFYNFYQTAPVEEVERYIEDMALWGINTVLVWYDMHHFKGFNDQEAIVFRKRLYQFMNTARYLGIDVGFVVSGNEGYASSPINVRAVSGGSRGGQYSTDVCPNKPGGLEYIMRTKGEFFDWCRDMKPSYICIWPYDQGGCGSADCHPWGSNGFIKCARAISVEAREKIPNVKIVISTWYFDNKEWKGLSDQLAMDHSWADMILAEKVDDGFKGIYPGVPGNLPMVGFPEISMYNTFPWGGFGATPLPNRVMGQWQKVQDMLNGGFLYSEGIFDDITKAVYSQLYWNAGTSTEQTLREYISYEYSPKVADSILKVIKILEQNHHMRWWPGELEGIKLTQDWFPSKGELPQDDPEAEEAYNLIRQTDAQLPGWARKSWRWRILYIRAMLDAELKVNGGSPNQECIKGFKELMSIYHTTEKSDPVIKPPIPGMQKKER